MNEIKNVTSSFENVFKKEEVKTARDIFEKEVKENVIVSKAPSKLKRKLKVHIVTANHLILVDEKMNGFRIPLPAETVKVGDTIYTDF